MVKKVLMISLGNTCRSPIAEGVMQSIIIREGLEHKWQVNSACIKGSQAGSLVDPRAITTLKRHGIEYGWYPRKVQPEDFHEFNFIFAMDNNNIRTLEAMKPKNCTALILMLGDFGLPAQDRFIMDPYHLVGEVYFEKVYQQCVKACDAFIKYSLVEKI